MTLPNLEGTSLGEASVLRTKILGGAEVAPRDGSEACWTSNYAQEPWKVSQISNLIKDNPRIGFRDIEEETGISKSLVGSIIKEDLQLKKTPSKFVPKMLTIQQKENRVEVAKKKKGLKWWKKTLIGRKNSKNLIIHHDNAPPHTTTSVLTYLAEHDIQILQQSPYFPKLAPNDFFLLPKLKMSLKGRIFDTRESIIADSKKVLENIPKDAFSKCFKSWEKRWKLCIDAGRDYFEKYY
ncbi:hypothetical protein LAZ67_9003232 [Cordylochernes scorpioides]|uniref:Transposase n=1 Tax=Cordylochernes scorpioides TaxID=51811 RepID=A0ABY6KUV6_9ARAC|nr:hypothetical protein LAZ67_9003232 [Cordylochernes scorpioides]